MSIKQTSTEKTQKYFHNYFVVVILYCKKQNDCQRDQVLMALNNAHCPQSIIHDKKGKIRLTAFTIDCQHFNLDVIYAVTSFVCRFFQTQPLKIL